MKGSALIEGIGGRVRDYEHKNQMNSFLSALLFSFYFACSIRYS